MPMVLATYLLRFGTQMPVTYAGIILYLSVSVFIQRRACYGIKCAGESVYNVPEY